MFNASPFCTCLFWRNSLTNRLICFPNFYWPSLNKLISQRCFNIGLQKSDDYLLILIPGLNVPISEINVVVAANILPAQPSHRRVRQLSYTMCPHTWVQSDYLHGSAPWSTSSHCKQPHNKEIVTVPVFGPLSLANISTILFLLSSSFI